MKTRPNVVFMLLGLLCLSGLAQTKDLLLHTIQYKLSKEKLLTMATVNLYNDLLPAFIYLQPQIQIPLKESQTINPLLVNQGQLDKKNVESEQQNNVQSRLNFHKKLNVPIKVLIHNHDSTQQQCFFDEPWDLCLIQNPQKKKSLDFSIHCLLSESSQQKKSDMCNGKVTVRQSDLTHISLQKSNDQQKTKYESGLFSFPSSDKHSVMLISCQDDDLPSFSESLKIYSNVKYHRYESQNSQEIKEFVGFDKSPYSYMAENKPNNQNNQNLMIAQNMPLDQKKKTQGTIGSQKYKKLTNEKDVNFIYLNIKEEMVRKCVQFEFYSTNKIVNERKAFDFINLTDTEYKNIYSIAKPSEHSTTQQKDQSPSSAPPALEYTFRYNLQLTLNIFKPSQIFPQEAYDIRIKLIDPIIKSTVISYTMPLAITNETLLRSTNLYSKSNHYHFTWVVGHEVVKQYSKLDVQVEFEAREDGDTGDDGTKKSHELVGKEKNNFFFITVSASDVQNVLVEKLMTSYISLKKDEHVTFLIEEPYEVDEIKTQTNTKSNDLVQVLPSSPTLQIKLSQHSSDHSHTKECHFSQGCKFQLDVVNGDCLECKIQYKTSFIKTPNDMLMLQIKENKFDGKIDLDQIQYFYKELKPAEVVEFIINTPNIIVYTLENHADQQRCKLPKKSCHSQIATSHQKIILSNQNGKSNQMVYFAVEGLDITRFSIILVTSDKMINIMNGIPFTYKLPSTIDQLELLFEVPGFDLKKEYENNITFNFIAPLNSLEMDILQMKDIGVELEAVEKSKTMSGFIKLSSINVKSSKLKVILSKTTHYLSHPVHFTLIASTSNHKFRLDTGITHYQSFDSQQEKTFIIEFQDKHTYELNLHFYDTPSDDVRFTVAVYNPNQPQENKQNLVQKINSKEWVMVFDDELVDKNDLCPENDPECTLFVVVENLMDHEVEVAMTLLTTDSVMELKDGVWQTFQLDDLLMRTHFYFSPTHDTNPVKIFFKSTDPSIFISALLYDNREKVNPAQWPFPETHGHHQEENFQYDQNYLFKSNHLIQIDNEDPEFKKCFPHCVLLLSILQGQKTKDMESSSQDQKKNQLHSLSILASNSQIQLPQKMRLNLELKPSEEQMVFIDLKQAYKQKLPYLTFFTNMLVGYAQIYAKVYLPSLQNIPDKDDYDLIFEPLKTQVSLIQIRDIFMQNIAWLANAQSIEEVLEKEQLYLALLIIAEQPTKLTLQYTNDYSQITQLSIDSTQTVSLSANEQKLFQFYPTRDQKIRFIRNKGYPLFHQFKCDANKEGFDNCLNVWLQKLKLKTEDDIRTIKKERQVENELVEESPLLTDKKMVEMAELAADQEYISQYQVLKKTQTQHVIQCQRCIVFIWIYAQQPSELTIQLQSLNTETLLKQNELLTDYVEVSEYHRYYLPRVQKQFTSIILSINEGSPIVTVSDNFNYEQTKKGSEVHDTGRKVMLFSVPPVKALGQVESKAQAASFSRSPTKPVPTSFNTLFNNLHISITPQNNKPVSYTITYSSGNHETFLKNGIFTSQYLFENQNVTFYYKNENKSAKSYLTLTVQAPVEEIQTILKGIEIKMFSLFMDLEKNSFMRNQLAAQQPFTPGKSFKKLTTLTYEIPPFDDLQIDIFSKKTTKITIGLTNGKIIFLPLNYEYPIFLHPKEEIKFVVENLQQGEDIEFSLKKCDQSNPSIFYTMDEKQFQKDIYSNYDKFGTDSVYKHVSKTKEKTPLFIKIKADPKETSTLVIKSNYVYGEDNFVDLDPGNMGLISYQFEDLKTITLKFKGLECGRECGELVQYYLVRGKSLQKLYNELVCAGQPMVKLFEKQTSSSAKKHVQENSQTSTKLQKNPQSSSSQHPLLSDVTQDISIQPLTLNQQPSASSQQQPQPTYTITVPYSTTHPIISIKAIYTPTGQESYYRAIEPKTLQSSVSNYSTHFLYVFVGAILIALVVLVWITQKLARKGYVHVGQDQTMVV